MLSDSGIGERITYTFETREEFPLPSTSSQQLTASEFQEKATGSMAATIASMAMSTGGRGGGALGSIGAGRNLPQAFHQQDEASHRRAGGSTTSVRTKTHITSMAIGKDSVFVGTSEGAVFKYTIPSSDTSKMSHILASTAAEDSNTHKHHNAHSKGGCGESTATTAFQQQLLKRLQQHKPTAVFTAHRSEVVCMVCHPIHSMLITGGSDSLLRTWALSDSTGGERGSGGGSGHHQGGGGALSGTTIQHGQVSSSSYSATPTTTTNSATAGALPFLLQTLAAHDAAVTCVVASTRYVISGSVDKSVRIWAEKKDALTATCWLEARQVFVFTAWVTSIYTVPEPKGDSSSLGELMVGDGSGCLTAFTLNETRGFELGKQTPISSTTNTASGDAAGITKIIPMPEINKVVLLGFSSTVWLLNLFSCEISQTVTHPEASSHRFAPRFVSAVSIPNADGEILLQDNKGLLFIYSSKGGSFVYSTSAFEGSSGMVVYAPRGSRHHRRGGGGGGSHHHRPITTTSSGSQHIDELCGCSVLLINDSGRQVVHCRITKVKTNDVRVAESRVNALVAIGSGSGRSHAGSACFVGDKGGESGSDSLTTDMSSQRRVASNADDDVKALISAEGSANEITFWSSQLLKLYRTKVPGSEVTSICYIPERHWVAAGHESGSMTIWMVGTGNTLTFKAHDNTVCAIGLGYHRLVEGRPLPWSHLYTISFDGCLALWDLPSYTDTEKSAVHRCDIRIRASNSELLCAAYDSLKYLYLVGDSSGDITLWSAEDLKPLMRLRGIMGGGGGSSVGGGGGGGGMSSLLDFSGGHRGGAAAAQRAHTAAVTCIELDGNHAFTGGEDDRILLWNTATGECLKEIDVTGIVKKSATLAVRDEVLPFDEVVALGVCPSGDLVACSRSLVVARFSYQDDFRPVSFYLLKQEPLSMAVYDASVYVGTEDGAIVIIPLVAMTPCGHLKSST